MNILEMNHVSKTFGSSRVLSDIHLSVGEGEIHALLGENGAENIPDEHHHRRYPG